MQFVDVLIACLFFVLLFLWGLPRLLGAYIKHKETTISPMDLHAKLSGNAEIVLIDIRKKKNFNNFLGHIVQAINIPAGNMSEVLTANKEELDDLKEVAVIVMDQTDSLAGLKATRLLRQNGFKNVLLLQGGLVAWIKAKLPTTKLEVKR